MAEELERITAAASDMGFDDPQHMLEVLEGQGLTVVMKTNNLESEVAHLKETLAAAEQRREVAENRTRTELARVDAAEAKLASETESYQRTLNAEYSKREALDVEVARLKEAMRAKLIDREEKFVAKHAQLVAAESRLAAANALLEQCADGEVDGFAIRAHLANQPAGPARTVAEPVPEVSTVGCDTANDLRDYVCKRSKI